MIKNEKGVTLLTLATTVVVLMILIFTVTINVDEYGEQKRKSNFEVDLQRLKEEVDYYYAKYHKLPIINEYTSTFMLENVTNVNDNDKYYVIDLKRLEVKLNYGKDYSTIIKKDASEKITDLFDVYIINEQSHTIYYPKGVKYDGTYHCTSDEIYHNIEIEEYLNQEN